MVTITETKLTFFWRDVNVWFPPIGCHNYHALTGNCEMVNLMLVVFRTMGESFAELLFPLLHLFFPISAHSSFRLSFFFLPSKSFYSKRQSISNMSNAICHRRRLQPVCTSAIKKNSSLLIRCSNMSNCHSLRDTT